MSGCNGTPNNHTPRDNEVCKDCGKIYIDTDYDYHIAFSGDKYRTLNHRCAEPSDFVPGG